MMRRILVLGLGNILLQDEGVGVQALRRLQARYAFTEEVRLMDGGTCGLDLLPHFEGITDLLILDAVAAGQVPGTLVHLEGDELVARLALKMSLHQAGLQELLAVARFLGVLPKRVILLGVQPLSLEWGMSLTGIVNAALDRLVESAVQALHEWGCKPRAIGVP